MQWITRKEFFEKLETFIQQKIYVKIEGNIEAEIIFEKFNYQIQYDFITMEDMTNHNHIGFNLNNINFMAVEKQKVICILNDQKDTKIEIKMND